MSKIDLDEYDIDSENAEKALEQAEKRQKTKSGGSGPSSTSGGEVLFWLVVLGVGGFCVKYGLVPSFG